MRGNHHVRFLGEDAVERPHPYPTQSGAGIHENKGLEDFAGMDDRHGERADRNDIEADNAVFGIEATDHELFTVDALEAGSKKGGGCH